MPKIPPKEPVGAGRELANSMDGATDDSTVGDVVDAEHITLDSNVVSIFTREHLSTTAPSKDPAVKESPTPKAGVIGSWELPAPVPLSTFIHDGLNSPEPAWLIRGLIPYNGITLMSGQQKLAMKTFTVMQLGVSIATGRSTRSIETMRRGPVLGLFEEGRHQKLASRYAAICDAMNVDWRRGEADDFFMVYRPLLKLDGPECRKQLLKVVREVKPLVVILDPFFRMMDGDENRQEDVNHAMDTLFALQQQGCTPLFLAHLTGGVNPKQDIDAQIRGSTLISNSYDVHIALRRYKRTEKYVSFEVRSRDAEPFEGIIKWDIRHDDGDDPERATYAQCMFVEATGDE